MYPIGRLYDHFYAFFLPIGQAVMVKDAIYQCLRFRIFIS